jgi:hypothetical protein
LLEVSNESLRGLKPFPFKFPRKCNCCGREYLTEAEFLQQTNDLNCGRSSLKQAEDDEGQVIVEVYRNCVCGSTLMDEFQSRRDDSPEGQRKRQVYANLQKTSQPLKSK